MSLKLNKTMSGLVPPTASTPGVLGEIGANVNSVIVVGFAEFEVYGKLNGSWEQIGESFFPDLEFDSITTKPGKTVIDLTKYEDVYFVSKSGKEEAMRFFFIEDDIVSHSSVRKATKLEEISDMPSFTEDDAGKILSVDAQGNLAWITR